MNEIVYSLLYFHSLNKEYYTVLSVLHTGVSNYQDIVLFNLGASIDTTSKLFLAMEKTKQPVREVNRGVTYTWNLLEIGHMKAGF